MKKSGLTLFLVFLVVLMPISIALPDVYVSIDNGQVQVSSDSCKVSREVDCSGYSEGRINEIKTKSVKDIKDEDVDYLIGALNCNNLINASAKAIGDIASKSSDIPKDHPITRTIPSLISLTNFDGDRNKVERYKGRINNVLYALLYVVDHSGARISFDDAFFENLVTASILNPDSKKYAIALLGTLADQSDDFTPYFSKHSLGILDIVTELSIDENSGYYFAYGANKILRKIEVDVFTYNKEFPALKKIINLLGESLGYEKSMTIALSAIYSFIGDKVVGKPNSYELLYYFLDGGNDFHLLDSLSLVLVQGNPSEKTDAFYSIDSILGHLELFTIKYKSYLSANNKLEEFKRSLMEINTASKSSDEDLYQSSLMFLAEFSEPRELSGIELTNDEVNHLLEIAKSRYAIARKNILFLNKNFNDIYSKLGSVSEYYKRYSLTLSVWRYMLESGKTVDESIREITTIRSRFVNTEILGPDKYLIVFTHDQPTFKNENIIAFAKESGVLDQNIAKDTLEDGNYFFRGPNDKDNILKTISNSNGETVIWFSGHGSKNALWLTEGEVYSLDNGFVESNDKNIRINYIELGNALKSRKNLGEVTIILDSCFSYNFAKNLYAYLGNRDALTIITASNKGSLGYGGAQYIYRSPDYSIASLENSVFLSSLMQAYIDSGRTGPLKGSHIFVAEIYSIKQDSAIFFGGPVEIASNSFENTECGMCENGICPV